MTVLTVGGEESGLPEIFTLPAGGSTEIVTALEVAAAVDGDGLQSYVLPTGTESGLPLTPDDRDAGDRRYHGGCGRPGAGRDGSGCLPAQLHRARHGN